MTRRYRRHRPFFTLSKRKRGKAVIYLRNEMRNKALYYGGRFYSHHVLEEEVSEWFDACFPGTNRFTLWNAEIVTARLACWDQVCSQAHKQAWAELHAMERSEEARMDFEPASFSRTGKPLTYQWVRRTPARYARFDGRTLGEQVDWLSARILREQLPVIHESFQLDRSYAYGIGLRIVVDVEYIGREVVEQVMDRFFALGEADWTAPEPVSPERLLAGCLAWAKDKALSTQGQC